MALINNYKKKRLFNSYIILAITIFTKLIIDVFKSCECRSTSQQFVDVFNVFKSIIIVNNET